MSDATVMCWGRNEVGQVGDGTTTLRLSPVAVQGLRDVSQIAVAREAACALRTDHTVWCGGSNDAGQLGDGTKTEHHTPVRVAGLSDVASIAAGTVHMCAIRATGTVVCWGWDWSGQVGDGRSADSAGPVAVAGVDRAIALRLTLHHSCALRSDGEVLCWGSGMRGVLNNGLQANQPVPAPVKWSFERPAQHGLPAGVRVASFSLDTLHTCASLSDGSVRCWGRNDGGMVLPGSKQDAFATPTPVPGVSRAQRVVVAAWATQAQLADGSTVSWGRDQPVHTTKLEHGATFITSGDFLCQLRSDATVTCSGRDPGDLTASDVVHVVANMHVCVLHKNGTVACAGLNNHGQLGDGTSTDRKEFTAVRGVRGATELAVGNFYTCALLADRTVTCCGDIAMTGQGDASTDGPVQIRGLRDVVQLAGGDQHACVRRRDRSVACWGHYRHVMRGERSRWYSATPVNVPWLAGATQFALGMFHSCVMLPGGLACWGKNDAGQLGDGTMDDRDEAVPVRW